MLVRVLFQRWTVVLANISLEWASGDRNLKAEWDYGTTTDGINYHKVWKQEQQVFHERQDQAEWGNIVSTENKAA